MKIDAGKVAGSVPDFVNEPSGTRTRDPLIKEKDRARLTSTDSIHKYAWKSAIFWIEFGGVRSSSGDFGTKLAPKFEALGCFEQLSVIGSGNSKLRDP